MFEAVQISAEIFSRQLHDDDTVICFDRQDVLMAEQGFPCWKDVKSCLPEKLHFCYLGILDGNACCAVSCLLPDECGTLIKVPCRQVLSGVDDAERSALCRGRELLAWAAGHKFCGSCRSQLTASATDLALICPECKEHYYPQIAPAVIVAVTRNNGREILLAHNRNFRNNMYSLIAGFVEAGECAESACAREIMEECGISVKNIRYFTSQVWPFPNSLMLAFTAEYDSGTAEADGVELSDLGWYTAENHPELPSPGSVARKVIDSLWKI